MQGYYTASFPVLCKNGVWADAASGRRLVAEEAMNGNVKFQSVCRKTVNQKLKESLYGFTIDCNPDSLVFTVFESNRVNKHGLSWSCVYEAEFRSYSRIPRVVIVRQHKANYWLEEEGLELINKGYLLRRKGEPSIARHCSKLWECRKNAFDFYDNILLLLRDWLNGKLENNIRSFSYKRNGLKEFKFGVEIEFTGISRDSAARTVARVLGTSKEYVGGALHTHEMLDRMLRKWKIVRDSSVYPRNSKGTSFNPENYKCELVTPVLNYDEDMPVLKEIIIALKKRGAVVNNSCGIHIHVDVSFNAYQLRNLANIIASKERLLKKAVKTSFIREEYCEDSDMDFVKKINTKKKLEMFDIRRAWYNDCLGRILSHYDRSRYVTLNLHSYFRGKGVEFRCFNSTLDVEVLKTYILLSLAICNQSAKQNRASYKPSTSNDRVALNNWMNQMGLNGEEFHRERTRLLTVLCEAG
ncbi:MAG: amidoligase family protein [Oscillospiraceae bacterium]|nr:amidoligase family protein [Oscillospiraceae bacterium]